MDKITFKNGQAPYINDETLNQMQDNVEKAIEEKSSLPTGGTKSQVLAKASDTDNDVEWVDNEGGVAGDTLPIGTIVDYSGEEVPTGWQEVESRFAFIETDYATGTTSPYSASVDFPEGFNNENTFIVGVNCKYDDEMEWQSQLMLGSEIEVSLDLRGITIYSGTHPYKFKLALMRTD